MFLIALKKHHFKPHFQKNFWGGQGPPNPPQMAEVYLLENDGRGKKLKGKKKEGQKRGKRKGEEKKGKKGEGKRKWGKKEKNKGWGKCKKEKMDKRDGLVYSELHSAIFLLIC